MYTRKSGPDAAWYSTEAMGERTALAPRGPRGGSGVIVDVGGVGRHLALVTAHILLALGAECGVEAVLGKARVAACFPFRSALASDGDLWAERDQTLRAGAAFAALVWLGTKTTMVTSSSTNWYIAEQTCVLMSGGTNANSQFHVTHSTVLTRLQAA